jgi:ABC-2 type transport system ATP-binding protein
MIEIRDLTVRYPGAAAAAVDHLSLSVGAGEVFGFIGPNGAGKTTTLKVLAGLQAPTSGTARVAGVDVRQDPAGVRRRIGFMPDFFGVYEELTCREYLDFFASAQGLPRARREAVIDEVLALVDLGAKADQLAGALSRGMQQRLGLARVLVHEPDVLLLDEPASGLDPRARIEIREVLRELGSMGRTVILSSHVLSDLASACTSVAIVERGRLAYAGSVRHAIARAGTPDCAVRLGCVEGAAASHAALAAGIAGSAGTPGAAGAAGTTGDGSAALGGASFEEIDGLLRITRPLDPARDAEDQRCELAAAAAAAAHRAGLRMSHLEIERADLERAFMALTAGELA